MMLTPEQITQFQDEGFVVIPGLFSLDEVERYQAHYMAMNKIYQSNEIKDQFERDQRSV